MKNSASWSHLTPICKNSRKKNSSFSKISRGTPKYTIFITKYFQKREHFGIFFIFFLNQEKTFGKVKISKNSREKPQNSRKKPKTQGKNSTSRIFDTRPQSKLMLKKCLCKRVKFCFFFVSIFPNFSGKYEIFRFIAILRFFRSILASYAISEYLTGKYY